MTYGEAVRYIERSIPNYQLKGKSAIRPGLSNIRKITNLIGKPQNSFKTIHIGGTNGKGTTATSISNILIYNQLKVGLLTSPHIFSFRERIMVNGEKIEKKYIIEFLEKHMSVINKISPSFFELITAISFSYFKKKKVDIAIIEVGLGGKLDSTNIIKPLLSLITNIGLDHQNILGKNLKKIAIEKSGIIKKNSFFLKGKKQPTIDHIFEKRCNDLKIKFIQSSEKISIKTVSCSINNRLVIVFIDNYNFKINLSNPTNYYLENLPGIILSSYYVLKKLKIELSEKSFLGITSENEKIKINGRWQLHSKEPYIISDGCHNIDGFRYIIKEINKYDFNKVYFILGGTKEKDWDIISSELPTNFRYIITEPNSDRALPVSILSKFLKEKKLNFVIKKNVKESIKYAKLKTNKDDLIFIGGSLFLISQIDEK